MASVATPERKKRAARRGGRREAESKRGQSRQPSSRGRTPSKIAVQAGHAFRELAGYFALRSDLQKALGWTAPSVRQWLGEDVPARPRKQSIADVGNLLKLCRAAGFWVSDPQRVGEWVITPHPELDDVAPAEMVRRLGREAVKSLVANMAGIAPREHVAPKRPNLSVKALRATLESLGAPSIAPAKPVAEIDLSDFDD